MYCIRPACISCIIIHCTQIVFRARPPGHRQAAPCAAPATGPTALRWRRGADVILEAHALTGLAARGFILILV